MDFKTFFIGIFTHIDGTLDKFLTKSTEKVTIEYLVKYLLAVGIGVHLAFIILIIRAF